MVSRGNDVLLQNVGTVIVYFAMGDSTAVATTNSIALQPGSAMTFNTGQGDPFSVPKDGMSQGATGLALFAPAGTGNINIAIGIGS